MSIQERINDDIKLAMKSKNTHKLAALRAVKSAIMLEATKGEGVEVTDEVSTKLIAKLAKQRKDSASIFIKQKRQDLADDEINELSYLELYLPDQMPVDEVRKIVKEVIAQLGASSTADLGKCIGLLMKRLNGSAEGSLISRLVREELS
jgi:hypothetical protein